LFADLAVFVDLSSTHLAIALAVVLAAGMVRGFAGFGLSAVVMASITTIIPPVELIPVCFVLEGIAGVVTLRGGMKDADMKIVWGFVLGSMIGTPIGLLAITTVDADTSKLVALLVILFLTLAQVANVRPRFLATNPGLYGSGVVAGLAGGLASVGGMVVALYVLVSGKEPKVMRASLVMFLFIGMFTSLIFLLFYQVMTIQALWRALVFTPLLLIGVGLGTLLFRPSLVQFYKRACLLLLVALCLMGLARLLL